jgi:GNAT superfamily N-acetyltransferase
VRAHGLLIVADAANLSGALRDTPGMPEHISAPRTDPAGLDELEPLWIELHSHHRTVSDYQALVKDLGVSWERRRRWYRRLLEQGASYITAHDRDGNLVGYAMVAAEEEPDDTFESEGGVAEVVTLVVAESHRSAGVGRALLSAAERVARDRGADTVKIALMAGNRRAAAFYETAGYSLAEHILYRRIDHRP